MYGLYRSSKVAKTHLWRNFTGADLVFVQAKLENPAIEIRAPIQIEIIEAAKSARGMVRVVVHQDELRAQRKDGVGRDPIIRPDLKVENGIPVQVEIFASQIGRAHV